MRRECTAAACVPAQQAVRGLRGVVGALTTAAAAVLSILHRRPLRGRVGGAPGRVLGGGLPRGMRRREHLRGAQAGGGHAFACSVVTPLADQVANLLVHLFEVCAAGDYALAAELSTPPRALTAVEQSQRVRSRARARRRGGGAEAVSARRTCPTSGGRCSTRLGTQQQPQQPRAQRLSMSRPTTWRRRWGAWPPERLRYRWLRRSR